MPNDMEQIEARLAGYIDGTLPPDQRAEIEAYLAANPGHGRLISELKSIKSAVGNLPRDKAPAEVMDAIQGQLERHALLDGVEDHRPARINRWPQLGAVAAMLLLMGGLGLLVYQVLPRDKAADQSLALLPTSSRAIVPDSELPDAQPVTLEAAPSALPDVAFRKVAQPKITVSPATKLGEAADQAAKTQTIEQLSNALVVPQGPVPTTPPSSNEVGRFMIGSATTQPWYTEWGSGAATQPEDVGYVVIQTADPVMTRNLMAATLAAAGHKTSAGKIETPSTSTAAPTTTYSSGHVDWTASVWQGDADSDAAKECPEPGQVAVGDAYLIVHDLQPSDIERLRAAAGAMGSTVVRNQASTRPAATSRPVHKWMLVFHAASPTVSAGISADLASPSTAPAAASPAASPQPPTTSRAAPATEEMP